MYGSLPYRHGPVWLQNLMLSARAGVRRWLREDAAFRAELVDVERSQWWDESALRSWQLERLKHVLSLAERAPHYREAFVAAGFSAAQFRSLEDLQRVPVLEKPAARAAGDRMLVEGYQGRRFENWTSGTTGSAMRAWRDLRSIRREHAFLWRQFHWAGAAESDRRVWIRGDRVVPVEQRKGPFWRHSRPDHMLMMSPYHLSDANLLDYLSAIEAFDPVFGLALPSVLVLFAKRMLDEGRLYRGRSLRGFVTSSETLPATDRRLIEKAFSCKVFDWYGSVERASAIGTCESGNYHVLSDYGMTEFVPQPDGSDELLCTSFDNDLMPWIRYRIGDSVVRADPGYRCPCGRHFPVIERINGRVEDYLFTADGRRVFLASDIVDSVGALESQIRQRSRDAIHILYVASTARPLDEESLRRRARAVLGEEMQVSVERVDRIPRTAAGKLRFVIRETPG